VVHIFFLIGFRNRIGVFRQWFYTYLTFEDGVRLIVGSQELPGWSVVKDEVPTPPVPNGPVTTTVG
jgi:NADH dehydrogenase